MKHIAKIVLLCAALMLTACQDAFDCNCGDEDTLELTNNNLSGDWQLVSFDGDAALAEGTYLYIRFIRKNTRFVMCSNLQGNPDSPVIKTGDFALVEYEDGSVLLEGLYDYTLSEHWSNPYEVTLKTDGTMLLQPAGNPGDVCTYTRCTIPEELASKFPSTEE